MNNLENVESYSPSALNSYFFDNNIWMLLHCPIANAKKKEQKVYSRFLSQLVTRKCSIFTNALVLSEFANAYFRLDFNRWLDNNHGQDKKAYFKTQRGKETVVDIREALGTILSFCQRGTDDFNSINIGKVISDFGGVDFNDSYYLQLCTEKKWRLVSHDRAIVESTTTAVIISALAPIK